MHFSSGEYGGKNIQSMCCFFFYSDAVILWAMNYVACRIHTRGLVLDLSSDCQNSLVKVASMSTWMRDSYVEALGFNKYFLYPFFTVPDL
jgi:hypothetical protein